MAKSNAPSPQAIAKTLGAAQEVWDVLIDALREDHGVSSLEWKASKSEFGWMCQLKQKKRTAVYLTPEDGMVRVGIVLGERAVSRALASDLPDYIKTLIAEARPYAEGRGIRFSVHPAAALPIVTKLVAMKMSP